MSGVSEYTKNELPEKEIRKRLLFAITSNNSNNVCNIKAIC